MPRQIQSPRAGTNSEPIRRIMRGWQPFGPTIMAEHRPLSGCRLQLAIISENDISEERSGDSACAQCCAVEVSPRKSRLDKPDQSVASAPLRNPRRHTNLWPERSQSHCIVFRRRRVISACWACRGRFRIHEHESNKVLSERLLPNRLCLACHEASD